jgi:hypothetical protein
MGQETAFLIAPAEDDQVVAGSGGVGSGSSVRSGIRGEEGGSPKKNIANACVRGWQSSPPPIGSVGMG